jgi:hypothetical protein
MSKLTQQGLEESLFDAMEFGYKARERNENIQKARSKIAPHIKALVESCDNLPREILRIEFRKNRKTKVSTVLR